MLPESAMRTKVVKSETRSTESPPPILAMDARVLGNRWFYRSSRYKRISLVIEVRTLESSNGHQIMPALQGKTAVVTGGSCAIGLPTAKRFAKAGAYDFVT